MNISTLSDLLALCKLKVVALIVLTAVVGMFMATPGMVDWPILIFASIGIMLAASSAAAINHVVDAKIDAKMHRTEDRPLPSGKVSAKTALIFALSLGVASMVILVYKINLLTATLTFFALLGYAVFYTMYLKRATPQNIVIGGLAGAIPPVLGWAAVTNSIDSNALLLCLIIFIWTPPHFWALAIHRHKDYAKAEIPMLPVTHGLDFTRKQILYYTILLVLVTILPYLTGLSGLVYLAGATILNVIFLYYAWMLIKRPDDETLPMRTFLYSINYLMLLFLLLLVDHYFKFSLTDIIR